MQSYSDFMSAYTSEMTQNTERVSTDVPTDMEEWKHIVRTTPVIVLYLWSNSCRPCHLVRDKFERLAQEIQDDNIRFYKDNIDMPTSFHRNQVEVVPTFYILCDGHELKNPEHPSIFHGWDQSMRASIQFHLSQSKNLLQRQQQNENPRFVCKNNVCYIQEDEEF